MVDMACPDITIVCPPPQFGLVGRHNQWEIFEFPFWPVPMVDADQVLTEIEIVIMAGVRIDCYSRIVLIDVCKTFHQKD